MTPRIAGATKRGPRPIRPRTGHGTRRLRSGHILLFAAPCAVSLGVWLAAGTNTVATPPAVASASHASGDSPPVHLYDIGLDPGATGTFDSISGLAIGVDGHVLVSDGADHRIQRFTPKGEHYASWGGFGTAAGRMTAPHGVASAPDGTVWVYDAGNARQSRFLPDGTHVGHVPLPAPGARSGALTVAPDGSVYATIRRGTAFGIARTYDGVVEEEWSEGTFEDPTGIAATSGQVFVVDRATAGMRVVVMDLTGRPQGLWGPGLLRDPHGAATDSLGRLVVADSAAGGTGGVIRFAADGAMELVATPGFAPRFVAGGSGGRLAIADEHRVQVADVDGTVASWGGMDEVAGLAQPAGLATLPGDVLVLGDAERGWVRRYTALGVPLGDTPLPSGTFPRDVAAGPNRLWVLPQSAWTVAALDATGAFVGSYALPATTGAYAGLGAFAGGFLVADTAGVVTGFDALGVERSRWDGASAAEGPFDQPSDAVGFDGGALVAEESRLRRVDADGETTGAWELPPAPEPAGEPKRLASGGGDTILVADSGRVLAYARDGEPLFQTTVPSVAGAAVADLTGLTELGDGWAVADGGGRVAVYGSPGSSWVVTAYPNRGLAGSPVSAWRTDALAYAWGTEAPAEGLPRDGFSIRARAVLDLPDAASRYQFTLEADGGARLWLGNDLAADAWNGGASGKYEVTIPVSGLLAVTLEYNDPGGNATLALAWDALADGHSVHLPRTFSQRSELATVSVGHARSVEAGHAQGRHRE